MCLEPPRSTGWTSTTEFCRKCARRYSESVGEHAPQPEHQLWGGGADVSESEAHSLSLDPSIFFPFTEGAYFSS